MTRFLIILILIIIPRICLAQQSLQERRVEEEKKRSLRPAEVVLYPQISTDKPPEALSNNDFFNTLIRQKYSTHRDGLMAVSILLGRNDELKDFNAQKRFFENEQILSEEIAGSLDPQGYLRKGQLAYMLCKALNIKGGLTMRIFGVSQRYALKELVYQGIMLPGHIRDRMSGRELIWTLTQAANYLSQNH